MVEKGSTFRFTARNMETGNSVDTWVINGGYMKPLLNGNSIDYTVRDEDITGDVNEINIRYTTKNSF